jgi:hypothetical protein
MDLEQVGDHIIGVGCGFGDDPNSIWTEPGQGNAECEVLCLDYCANLGTGYEMLESNCEGYCQEGTRADMACNADVECPEGACSGGDPPAHRNKCQCSCVRRTGDPAPPGAMHCSAGIQIIVEYDPPCESENGINDTFILLPTICVPLTTETANGKILDSNAFPGAEIVGLEMEGVRGACPDLATSVTTGIEMAGNISIFDSSIGDLQVQAVVRME